MHQNLCWTEDFYEMRDFGGKSRYLELSISLGTSTELQRGWDCHHFLNISRKHPCFLTRDYGWLEGLIEPSMLQNPLVSPDAGGHRLKNNPCAF